MIDYENEAAEVRARINSLLKEKGVTQNAVAAGDAPAQKRLNSRRKNPLQKWWCTFAGDFSFVDNEQLEI